jgi:hypothetical protein
MVQVICWIRMKFEEWQIGQEYDVIISSGPYPLGRLVQKYQMDTDVYLDFWKEEGGEYLYIVDKTETYVIHREPAEALDTSNTVQPSKWVDQA